MRLIAPRQAVALLALVGALLIAACGGAEEEPAAYGGIVRDPAPELGAISLPDVARDGAQTAMRAPRKDGLLLVFFGFTTCPDICPTTLADLKGAVSKLPEAERERLSVAMVTVDPERDTPAKLTAYVQGFFPDALALRTDDDAQLQRIARDFAAAYKVTKTPDGEVEVVHTAFVYAIGPDGRLLVQWPFGTTPDQLAADLELALDAVGGDQEQT